MFPQNFKGISPCSFSSMVSSTSTFSDSTFRASSVIFSSVDPTSLTDVTSGVSVVISLFSVVSSIVVSSVVSSESTRFSVTVVSNHFMVWNFYNKRGLFLNLNNGLGNITVCKNFYCVPRILLCFKNLFTYSDNQKTIEQDDEIIAIIK